MNLILRFGWFHEQLVKKFAFRDQELNAKIVGEDYMTEKQILEAQAQALKSAREKIAESINDTNNYSNLNQLSAQLIAVIQEERVVAILQMDRGYIKQDA